MVTWVLERQGGRVRWGVGALSGGGEVLLPAESSWQESKDEGQDCTAGQQVAQQEQRQHLQDINITHTHALD